MNLHVNQIKKIKMNMKLILTGDFNVIPEDNDAHDIKKYKKDALAQPETRKKFNKLLNLDLLDVFKNEIKKLVILSLTIKLINLEKKKGLELTFF
jgi:exodeoxyribonuclease-3